MILLKRSSMPTMFLNSQWCWTYSVSFHSTVRTRFGMLCLWAPILRLSAEFSFLKGGSPVEPDNWSGPILGIFGGQKPAFSLTHYSSLSCRRSHDFSHYPHCGSSLGVKSLRVSFHNSSLSLVESYIPALVIVFPSFRLANAYHFYFAVLTKHTLFSSLKSVLLLVNKYLNLINCASFSWSP
jgi:hypothetical protein